MTIKIISTVLALGGIFLPIKNIGEYKIAFRHIVKSSELKAFNIENGIYNTKIYVSEHLIPFDLNTFHAEILRRKYIKSYSDFSTYSLDDKRTIELVADSILSVERKLNSMLKKKCSQLTKLGKISEANYVLYFSPKVDNHIYAELIPINIKISNTTERNEVAFGKALTFLFIFDSRGLIQESYSGFILFN